MPCDSREKDAAVRAAPFLIQEIEVGSFRDANDCDRIMVWPFDGAVGTSQSAERNCDAVFPRNGDLGLIAGQKREARNQSIIAYADGGARGPAKRSEIGYDVVARVLGDELKGNEKSK